VLVRVRAGCAECRIAVRSVALVSVALAWMENGEASGAAHRGLGRLALDLPVCPWPSPGWRTAKPLVRLTVGLVTGNAVVLPVCPWPLRPWPTLARS
jgi:hypothetical protein